jgi:hypothetical protein
MKHLYGEWMFADLVKRLSECLDRLLTKATGELSRDLLRWELHSTGGECYEVLHEMSVHLKHAEQTAAAPDPDKANLTQTAMHLLEDLCADHDTNEETIVEKALQLMGALGDKSVSQALDIIKHNTGAEWQAVPGPVAGSSVFILSSDPEEIQEAGKRIAQQSEQDPHPINSPEEYNSQTDFLTDCRDYWNSCRGKAYEMQWRQLGNIGNLLTWNPLGAYTIKVSKDETEATIKKMK